MDSGNRGRTHLATLGAAIGCPSGVQAPVMRHAAAEAITPSNGDVMHRLEGEPGDRCKQAARRSAERHTIEQTVAAIRKSPVRTQSTLSADHRLATQVAIRPWLSPLPTLDATSLPG